MIYLNEYTLKSLGLKGDCDNCSCQQCSKNCTNCDWIAVHGPINCHDVGIKNCSYITKNPQKPNGYSDLDKREDAKKQAEELVFIKMSRGDIECECKNRGIKITNNRINMESKLIEIITEEILKIR